MKSGPPNERLTSGRHHRIESVSPAAYRLQRTLSRVTAPLLLQPRSKPFSAQLSHLQKAQTLSAVLAMIGTRKCLYSAMIFSRGEPMANMSGVVEQLKKELERARKEVERYRAALVALGSSSSNGSRRTMSAAGRRRISLAQKARWARQNGQAKTARPKRAISAAGRRRIAAAQRARWAKVKGQEKAA